MDGRPSNSAIISPAFRPFTVRFYSIVFGSFRQMRIRASSSISLEVLLTS